MPFGAQSDVNDPALILLTRVFEDLEGCSYPSQEEIWMAGALRAYSWGQIREKGSLPYSRASEHERARRTYSHITDIGTKLLVYLKG